MDLSSISETTVSADRAPGPRFRSRRPDGSSAGFGAARSGRSSRGYATYGQDNRTEQHPEPAGRHNTDRNHARSPDSRYRLAWHSLIYSLRLLPQKQQQHIQHATDDWQLQSRSASI